MSEEKKCCRFCKWCRRWGYKYRLDGLEDTEYLYQCYLNPPVVYRDPNPKPPAEYHFDSVFPAVDPYGECQFFTLRDGAIKEATLINSHSAFMGRDEREIAEEDAAEK